MEWKLSICQKKVVQEYYFTALRKLIADGVLSDKDMVAYLSGGKKGTHSFLEINQVGDVLDE